MGREQDSPLVCLETVRLAPRLQDNRGVVLVLAHLELALQSHVGAVVEREVFCRSLVKLVDLRKTDFRIREVGDVAVRVYARVHLALLGVVFPRSVKVAGSNGHEQDRQDSRRHETLFKETLHRTL